MKVGIFFTGSGPILVLTTYEDLRDANLAGSVLSRADFEGVQHPGLQLAGVVMPSGYSFRGGVPGAANHKNA